jgi:hypothetical protein
MARVRKLLFVDTNIWLDFYRARSEAGLALLKHLEQITDKIIVTFQLEMEFKKNRHTAMMEGMQELKPPPAMSRPGLFSDAKALKAIQRARDGADKRIRQLKARYVKALNDPAGNDPVYQACQRIFHKNDALSLTRDMRIRKAIRTRAMRRFMHGCPPRKKGDTSFGDALNWEWMIECANSENAELVIVSRDSDYGIVFQDRAYPNDHLLHEFSERVSRQRKLLLYAKVSDALKHFQVNVSEKEKREEEEIVAPTQNTSEAQAALEDSFIQHLVKTFNARIIKSEPGTSIFDEVSPPIEPKTS